MSGMFRIRACEWSSVPLVASLFVALLTGTLCRAQDAGAPQLRADYQSNIQPLLERYCHDCHDGASAEGDIDLAALKSGDDAARQPKTWQKVAEMLENRLMPPRDADQPSPPELARLQKWVADYLAREARDRDGDPGPVVLRRLNNVEYTNTIRDLTGVASLDPAREFPADSAAGEGFTNTGNSLVMSPALVTKYLDAAKEVASHAVLLPDGFRFSPHTTARDWTDEIVGQIRSFYGQFSDATGGTKVNLQGVVFDTNQGGRLPIEKYLAATLSQRKAISDGQTTIDAVARQHGLSAKYLGALWTHLNGAEPSLLSDHLRMRWREAKEGDAPQLAQFVEAWQKALWNFNSVGLIGRSGGPKRWMEAVTPVTSEQELAFKIPESPDDREITISLVASDAGDGNESDFVVWKAPRLVVPGQADLPLRDLRSVIQEATARRDRLFANAAACLNAADELVAPDGGRDVEELARTHQIDVADLRAWLDYLGIGVAETNEVRGLFSTKVTRLGGYEFVNGWGSNDTPSVAANSSNEHVRIPGNVKPRGVVVHPSPQLGAAVAWRSIFAGTVRIAGTIVHAHPECGNGVTWSLELRRGQARQRLANGIAQGASEVKFGPFDRVRVQKGDLVALVIGPRDANHVCDLTAIDLEITDERASSEHSWNLAADVAPDILAGNPHADRFGNADVWCFFSEPDAPGASGTSIPSGSLLAKWQAESDSTARKAIAAELQQLLTSGPPPAKDSPDAALYQQLTSVRGPLSRLSSDRSTAPDPSARTTTFGLDPGAFGRHPDGNAVDAADLCVRAPAAVEIVLPADFIAGCELRTSAVLDARTGQEGSAQVSIALGKSVATSGLLHGDTKVQNSTGHWLLNNPTIANSAPIIVMEGSTSETRVRRALDEFRNLFPPALCYTKIVPVDEAISVTLFYREDEHLSRLMLDEAQRQELDRLWDELHFVSRDALSAVDAFAQLLEFATQDADPKVFEPMRGPINDRAIAFRKRLVDCERKQVEALLDFAERAYRRSLSAEERGDLRELYKGLRDEGLPHEEAFRLTLARVLAAPACLYRIEHPVPGTTQGPVSDSELATRLSYFLWATAPDEELRERATAGTLHETDVLVAQTERMTRDPKIRSLATEFACHWLQIDGFEQHDEKSEQHFPTFAALRSAMAEESVLFFTDLFQNNGSLLNVLDADYTFLNESLARHYEIPGVTGDAWRRVEGVKKFSRGGVLAQATTLAKQSGASRTSPILRGNWISETLLGERSPKPPKGVPPLPDEESATQELTVRQLVEKHVSDAKCSVCHRRIDPYGFALEAFDAIGRHRNKDLGDRPVDTKVKVMDGSEFDGLEGLRSYLLNQRRDAFVRQFCRKLLGYALGRAVQLSDEPLLTTMETQFAAHDYKINVALRAIVSSRQFREIRGADAAFDD